jgi:Zn-dependent metalloprotease
VLTGVEAVRRARVEISDGERATVDQPELIVYAPVTRPARLAWKLEVSRSRTESEIVIIDAVNGVLLASIPTVMTENVVGSGRDLNGQVATLNVWNSNGTFLMVDTSKTMFDPTSQPYRLGTTRGAIFVLDARNTPAFSEQPDISQASLFYVTSNNPNSWSPPDAVSAATGLSRTFDYYRERLSRNSIDGTGGNVVSVVRLGQHYGNAYWSAPLKLMAVGDGNTFAGSLDVVAHELTHGVTSS